MKRKLYILFSLFPTLFVGIGAWLLSGNLNLLMNGIATEGKVLELSPLKNSGEDTTYCPYVEFTLENGNTHKQRINECSGKGAFKIGDPIFLLYDKEDLTNVRINTPFWMYGFPGIFIISGLAFLWILRRAYNKTSNI